MSRHSDRLLRTFALLVMLLFAGSLIADSIADAEGGCVAICAEQSGCADDCAICLTCSHGSALLPFGSAACADLILIGLEQVVLSDERVLDGPPARIDHPPQLA
jgi:hypothetical protein